MLHSTRTRRITPRATRMPAPRPSESAEAARAAALQAEFNEKKWVWVPDDREGYLAGWVVREEDEVGDVVMAAGGEVSVVYAARRPRQSEHGGNR